MDDVVITGMGIFSPIGCGEDAFWRALVEGKSGAGVVTGIDTAELSRRIGCQVKGEVRSSKFEVQSVAESGADKLNDRNAVANATMGRASRLGIGAADEAVASARLSRDDLSAARLAVIVGTTMGETEFIESRLSAPGENWLSAEHMQKIAGGQAGCIAANVRASLIGKAEAHTEAVDLYGACAAGNMAIAAARQQLLDGRCDIAIAGGADGFSHLAFLGFMRLRVMAAEICRPFDEKRDGLLVGEGAVLFVLEREATAKARGATVLARIAGAGNACENYHPTRPHPEGDGLTRSTMAALADAGIAAKEIDYICAHGTGTPQNDAIEVSVMNKCFPSSCAFSSIKGLTGHCMGAAAATEAALCVLALRNQTLIPTWHLDNVLQPCALEALRGGPRSAKLRYVLNNSAGFGGYNSSVILAAA